MSDMDSVTRIEIGMPVHDWNGSRIGMLEDIDQRAVRIDGHQVPVEAIDRILPEGIFLREGVVLPMVGAAGADSQANVAGSTARAAVAGGSVPLGGADTLHVPVVEERFHVEKRPTQGMVEVHKRVEQAEQVVREALAHDVVEVERVPVNRQVDGPVGQRMEGEWLVVPVMEEVLVVEKRLILKEEVRIRTRKETRQAEVHEELRRERVAVSPAGDTPAHHVVEVAHRTEGTVHAAGTSSEERVDRPDAERAEGARARG
ncbi:MAG: hypothetical protein AVDCRST_MAG77-3901 [uncultured Chloroflexi bacterium]|uniref:DUF2382 domain-containing protein n=1 Tax=uncultured Chloroflexota bacterium TaxID=166587 RepID=A0A6J4JLN8_9CHLR|nr:MAG: hypothetical protein AVDCRST_MAG77-3901 [uncultured Chloroflexota bacterium]